VYITRFGAKGGNLPAGTNCTGDRVVNPKYTIRYLNKYYDLSAASTKDIIDNH
jgi:hypothetical protein